MKVRLPPFLTVLLAHRRSNLVTSECCKGHGSITGYSLLKAVLSPEPGIVDSRPPSVHAFTDGRRRLHRTPLLPLRHVSSDTNRKYAHPSLTAGQSCTPTSKIECAAREMTARVPPTKMRRFLPSA